MRQEYCLTELSILGVPKMGDVHAQYRYMNCQLLGGLTVALSPTTILSTSLMGYNCSIVNVFYHFPWMRDLCH